MRHLMRHFRVTSGQLGRGGGMCVASHSGVRYPRPRAATGGGLITLDTDEMGWWDVPANDRSSNPFPTSLFP